MAKEDDDFEGFLNEKFPEQPDTGLDYSNPMSAAEQIRALKAAAAKKNIGVAETIRRLKSGRKAFD
ncbi:MAG: hypothetical protein WCS03_08070 [Bacteroidota bacterium]